MNKVKCKVYHSEIWGKAGKKKDPPPEGTKYAELQANDTSTTKWQELAPERPFYLFIPQDTKVEAEYMLGWKVNEIFAVNGVGMTTARDRIVIDFEERPILERARVFRDSPKSDEDICEELRIPLKKGWNVQRSRELISREKDLKRFVRPVLYRPFDGRLIFYHDSLVWRTVKVVMRHMLAGENLALLWTRPMSPKYEFSALATNLMVDQCAVGNKSAGAGISYLGPLYLYYENDTKLPEPKPNLNPDFVGEFENRLGLGEGDLGRRAVFDYIYAILHSPTYRERYEQFLNMDFPRIPLTSSLDLFNKLAKLGGELVDLHLLKHDMLNDPIAKYQGVGDDVVRKVRWHEVSGRVYTNETQYFEGVESKHWDFYIGGYQVLYKWLKDREKVNRKLTYDEIEIYCKIVTAIDETIRLMAEIDRAIPSWPIE